MNVLNAIGNIGKDAEVRFTPKNEPVATFSFALQSGYGEKQITTWINCQLWGKRAESLAPMLKKGSRIGVTGELTNRPYTAKDGTEKHSLELRVNDVTLLSNGNAQASKENAPKRQESQDKGGIDEMEDDIPFN